MSKLIVSEITSPTGVLSVIGNGLDFSDGAEEFFIPSGTSDQRGSAVPGSFRYNYDYKNLEYYDGSTWRFLKRNKDIENVVRLGLICQLDPSDLNSYPNNNYISSLVPNTSGVPYSTSIVGVNKSNSYEGTFTNFGGGNNFIISRLPTNLTNWTISFWTANFGPTQFSVVGHRTFVGSNCFRFQWDDNSSQLARGPFIDFNATGGGGSATFPNFTPASFFDQWHVFSVVSTGSTVTTYWNTTSGNVLNGSKRMTTDGRLMIGLDTLSGIGGADSLNRDGGTVYVGGMLVYDRALTVQELQQNIDAFSQRYV
jgi:hypothetical protein